MNSDDRGRNRYYPAQVEPKWRQRWDESGLHRTDLTLASGRPKHYNLMEFPYPSAEGLHVGHVYTYGGADTSARFLRMRGYEVFEPMGFDAFGIHSENFALRLNINPMQLTAQTTRRYREAQLGRIGAMFDWSRSVDTSDPSYYRWTQWIFLQLFKAGLAVRKEAPVNWCPKDLTVLANEQVIDGRCERCGTPIVQRELTQWFLEITAYADRLLADLDRLDWPDESKVRQANWIGRSEGAELIFTVAESDEPIPVFTTRPDTVFGATYLVLAPEHKLVPRVTAPDRRAEVEAYVEQARDQTEIERTSAEREKTGVFTGAYAINPATGRPVPIWVADYVLVGYGTGAIMAVPAHDERDHEFAQQFNLPIVPVVESEEEVEGAAYTGPGRLVSSGQFYGLPSDEAKTAITAWLGEQGKGRPTVTYRLRDWLISRQRYWGPPIPIVHCPTDGIVPVPEKDLPVLLPVVDDFRPTGTGKSPLASVESFVNTTCPTCGGPAERETDVSDNFLDSSWYYLRYPSTDFDDRPFDRQRTEQWLPVDMYFGGKEHVLLHHLYARFITKALHDLGHLQFDEPFRRLRLHGFLTKDGAKISKSRGNVVNPDEYVKRVGADAFRTYLLFMGPYDQDNDFSDTNLVGVTRFLDRVWRLATEPLPLSHGRDVGAADVRAAQRRGPGGEGTDMRPMHRYVKRLTDELASYQFHTAIAGLMEYANWISANRERFTSEQHSRAIETLVLLLAPFAPFLAEELWERLGKPYSVHQQAWPAYDPAQIEADTVTLIVQVNGKVRDRLEVAPDIAEETARTEALASPRVAPLLAGKQPRRVIYVPGRLINIVA
ncbi:MAG TPA: leucine--tRNA ligase [Chloroflexota bacterium]|nr:leucine--tRNA ligase [Chloroflexota bacterium]